MAKTTQSERDWISGWNDAVSEHDPRAAEIIGRLLNEVCELEKHQEAAVPKSMGLVAKELRKARAKFPRWPDDPIHAAAVVQEEAGELGKAALQSVYEPDKSGMVEVRAEAIQTAAMALRLIENIGLYATPAKAQHYDGEDVSDDEAGLERIPQPAEQPDQPSDTWLRTSRRSLPERDPERPAEDQGLFRKFEVRRTDGSDGPGEQHEHCFYFVLDVDCDPHALPAIRAYAESCYLTHPNLARDLVDRIQGREPALPPAIGNLPEVVRQIQPNGLRDATWWKETVINHLRKAIAADYGDDALHSVAPLPEDSYR